MKTPTSTPPAHAVRDCEDSPMTAPIIPEAAIQAADNAIADAVGHTSSISTVMLASAALTAAAPFLQRVKPEALQMIERMAFGYEVMFEKLCHIDGTCGVDAAWYRAKAREATDRIVPLYAVTEDSNKAVPGDCKTQYLDFMARIMSEIEAPKSDNKARRELDLSNILRHAFIYGFVAKGGTITDAINHWPDYNPEECSAYFRILSAISGVGNTEAPHPRRAQALEEAARNACMYLETGFIECPKCGEEVETKHTDAEYTLRTALSSQPVADGWLPIETAPKDETLFLAYCPADKAFPDGRMMIWKGSIFAFQKNPIPNHLQFPATHWRPLPTSPEASG